MSVGTDKGAWWADPSFGSELWLLKKEEKADGQTPGRLEQMIRESPRRLALKVDCAAEREKPY
jgi:phage gp46-like protein